MGVTSGEAAPQGLEISRRQLLCWAGCGVGLALIALPPRVGAAGLRRGPRAGRLPAPGTSARAARDFDPSTVPALALPIWSDGANFDAPEYYQTIQAGRRRFPKTVQGADIDGDGQAELLARGPGGILANRFDPALGQWLALPNGPDWSDGGGWDEPQYYRPIQTADLDGDGRAELIARDAERVEAWKYSPDPPGPDGRYRYTGKWSQLPDGPAWIAQYQFPGVTDWSRPDHYETIQCADVDGDGRAELLGRGVDGLQTWKLTASGPWQQMATLGDLGDDNGATGTAWQQPPYYETIQCADIDGDGRAEVVARGAGGVLAWKYDPAGGGWTSLRGGPGYSDARGWAQPQYYRTIQCADVDGDGRAELLGRAPDADPGGYGVQVWKYDPAGQTWRQMPSFPNWTDYWGWGRPQYFETIQCADIDGDGRAELLSRAPDSYPDGGGIKLGKFDPSNDTWGELPAGVAWTDDPSKGLDGITAWDQVQYFATITTARVFGDSTPADPANAIYPNTNDPPQPGGKAVAALLGRGFYSLQTWRFQPAGSAWTRISAPFPQFTGDMETAYQYLSQNLQSPNDPIPTAVDLRQRYAALDSAGVLDYLSLLPGEPFGLPKPAGVSDADWMAVGRQIHNELLLVNAVVVLRDATTTQLLVDVTIDGGSSGILTMVNDALQASIPQPPSDSSSGLFVTLIQIVANAAWALSSLVTGPAAPVVAAATGLLAAGSIGLSLFTDPDSSYSFSADELDQLRRALHTGFVNAVEGNATAAQASTQDWGLLQVRGAVISFDATTTNTVSRSYELYAYQQLAPVYWEVGGLVASDILLYSGDSQQYSALAGAPQYQIQRGASTLFLGVAGAGPEAAYFYQDGTRFGATETFWVDNPIDVTQPVFSRLFGPVADPARSQPGDGGLGVSFSDVILSGPGWHLPPGTVYNSRVESDSRFSFIGFDDSQTPPPGARPVPPPGTHPQKGQRLDVGTTLSRDGTGAVVAAVTLTNAGTRKLTNVSLTGAVLGGHAALLPGGQTRLVPGRSETLWLHFPAGVGTPGQRTVLRVNGTYQGGTFGGSFRVTLP